MLRSPGRLGSLGYVFGRPTFRSRSPDGRLKPIIIMCNESCFDVNLVLIRCILSSTNSLYFAKVQMW